MGQPDTMAEARLRDVLRDVRGALNRSQEILARDLGVTLSTLHRWESGRVPLQRCHLRHYRDYLSRPEMRLLLHYSPDVEARAVTSGLIDPWEVFVVRQRRAYLAVKDWGPAA